jgi:hypothetical protein
MRKCWPRVSGDDYEVSVAKKCQYRPGSIRLFTVTTTKPDELLVILRDKFTESEGYEVVSVQLQGDSNEMACSTNA